jgi:hypothetical protein
MRDLMPWTEMTSLRREMDRLFDRFFEPSGGESPATLGDWAPSLHLSEMPGAHGAPTALVSAHREVWAGL